MSWKGFEEYERLHKLWKQTGKNPTVLLQYRAEVLLERLDRPVPAEVMVVTEEEREELVRIASAPKDNDGEFLGRFDVIYEDDERRADDRLA